MIDSYALLGELPCIGCRQTVIWERVAGRWYLNEIAQGTVRRHACRPRCLARMRGGEECHRTLDHVGPHSSQASLGRRAAWMRARLA